MTLRATDVIRGTTRLLRTLRRRVEQRSLTPRDRAARQWIAAGHDRTLRLDYDLSSSSVVFDLGGYEGQWASDIFAMYQSDVYVFEPVPAFADAIARRFQRNDRIRVHDFGLAKETGTSPISLEHDRSSIFTEVFGDHQVVDVRLVRAATFLADHNITSVDLVKVNIEGGEYDLLEHLLDEGLMRLFRDVQVQFHDFVPDAERRMHDIRRRLASTHHPTYQVDFVWENWRRR